MDHHCPWVANCVGHQNYKYFMCMLYSTSFTCILIVSTTWPVVQAILGSDEDNYVMAYYVIVSYFLCLAMGIIITLFFAFHVYLITNAKTTIEFCEKKSQADENGNTVWDLGPKENLIAVFGPPSVKWILPVPVDTIGNGLRFQVNPNYNMEAKY